MIRTEKQSETHYKSVVIHIQGNQRKRGMFADHPDYNEARMRVAKLVAQAKEDGWIEKRKSRVKPEEFDTIPKPS